MPAARECQSRRRLTELLAERGDCPCKTASDNRAALTATARPVGRDYEAAAVAMPSRRTGTVVALVPAAAVATPIG